MSAVTRIGALTIRTAVRSKQTLKTRGDAFWTQNGMQQSNVQVGGDSLPFASGPQNKARIVALLATFMGTPFLIPFMAAKWTIRKNGRSNKWA